MRISVPFAILAVVGGLCGCASTPESEQGPTAVTAPMSSARQSTTTGVVGSGTGTGQSIGGATDSKRGTATDGDRPDLKRSVYYEFDQYDVKAEYRALVETHARWLRANPKGRLTIEGNTDERGSREYNVALGQRRAESVTTLMLLMGVKPEQIEAVSFGKEKPRAGGHDEGAWAENRRSDFAGR
jgi:peptidoglycan-associated lipoprotein